jgi:hypothetical protein
MRYVYIVIVPNGMLLAAYDNERHADMHARTVLGARVQPVVVNSDLPDAVRDDIASDDWDDNGVTPVQEPASDITKTQPSTPRSKAKSKPPT